MMTEVKMLEIKTCETVRKEQKTPEIPTWLARFHFYCHIQYLRFATSHSHIEDSRDIFRMTDHHLNIPIFIHVNF